MVPCVKLVYVSLYIYCLFIISDEPLSATAKKTKKKVSKKGKGKKTVKKGKKKTVKVTGDGDGDKLVTVVNNWHVNWLY